MSKQPPLFYIERLCKKDDQDKSIKLKEFRDVSRYVLLGEPGAGKTTAFIHEAEAGGSDCCYILASDFIDYEKEEWQGKTLFIDGLDEIIAIAGNRTPLNQIRAKLNQLKIQRYRISCREADWTGERDQKSLESAMGEVVILHLQGLSDRDIGLILNNDKRVPDANVFLEKAETFQLSNLLQNPQTLNMLIQATQGGNQWPNSKMEVYELACIELSKENNDEHIIGNQKNSFQTEDLLDAAGYLYAIQLIANAKEFITTEDSSTNKVSLARLNLASDAPHYPALKTRLFNQISHERSAPVHRSIGEFLAARHIAKSLDEGLSLRRCLALITGFDGGVVAALRGLYAWLCTLSNKARIHIIETDALGVVQYGDVSSFSVVEKLHLINALKTEAEKSAYLNYRDEKGFAGLISEDMVPHLKTILTNKSYLRPEQEVLTFVLDGMRHAQLIPSLKDLLLEVIKDSKYMNAIRWRALDVFIKYQDISALLALADEINANRIEDATDELMGSLLSTLFPRAISANDIFGYLKTIRSGTGTNVYRPFWEHDFLKSVEVSDIPTLLDQLVVMNPSSLRYGKNDNLFSMVGKLLQQGLEHFGTSIEPARLYDWLGIGMDEDGGDIYTYDSSETKQKISSWLESHPETYLSVLEVCLSKIKDELHFYSGFDHLWHAKPPAGIATWWLKQALAIQNQPLKWRCFIEAFNAMKREYTESQFHEKMQAWLKEHDEFSPTYDALTSVSEHDIKTKERNKKWKDKELAELQQRLSYFETHKDEIAGGMGTPSALHHIASAYFDHYSNVDGKTGAERLNKFFNNNEELVRSAIRGILKTLDRKDLPSIDEIFELSADGQFHYIRLPFLTAMEKKYSECPGFLADVSDETAGKALAFWYSYGAGNQPEWVKVLSLARPNLASQVIIAYMSTMFKTKAEFIYGSYALSHDADYAEIAKLVTIPLLEKFPTKSLKNHASCLEDLLKAAYFYVDHSKLLGLIEKKLKRVSLDVVQKVYLIATGLVICPVKFEKQVNEYISQTTERINYLSGFLYEGWRSNYAPFSLKISAIELLIKTIAPLAQRDWPESGGFVTKEMSNGDYINTLITKLSNDPSNESSQALERLISHESLASWRSILKTALQTQNINRREAEFTHPNILEVSYTLNQKTPANVSDLTAMVLDFLDELQREMHTTETDNYLSFWNENSNSKPTEPKVENSCRRYLAEKIKDKLSYLGIEVNSEALAANSKRTDIRLTYRYLEKRLALPIEIKRNSNAELWYALHKQLIPLYTNDPDTQGRGIYLILWFGESYNTSAKDGGRKPKSALELKTRLIASMTPAERKIIDVYVLNVSSTPNIT
jgi:hypothetical protein